MAYRKQTWRDYDDTKTEVVNMDRGAVVTPERMNHIETGIANSADKDEVTAQLAQTEQEIENVKTEKMDKNTNDISVYQLNKNKGLIDETFLSDKLKQQMAGDTPISAVTAKGSITKDRLTRRIISQEQTTFLNSGKNLYDKNSVLKGYFIDQTGNLIENEAYSTSDYFEVEGGETYHRSNDCTIAFYDSSFNFISRTYESSGVITAPENAVYARLATGNGYVDTYQFEKGDRGTGIEDYYLTFDALHLKENNFSDDIIPITSVRDLITGKNLYDKSKAIFVGIIDPVSGIVESSNTNAVTSNFIEIEGNTPYSKSHGANFAFFDEDKSVIPIEFGEGQNQYHSNMETFTSPINARFMRVSVLKEDTALFQLEQGVIKTPFEPFGYRIKDLLYQNDINNINNRLNNIDVEAYKPTKQPYPPTINPKIERLWDNSYEVKCLDNDSNVIFTRWDSVIYRMNKDNVFEEVVDLKPFLNDGETNSGYALLISETNRMIVATNQGRVLVSDESQTTFTEAFQFKAGYTQNTWGYDKQDQFILMASYGNKTAANPPREVYLSKNHGETWELIFDKPIDEMIDSNDYHIHDVAYDVYSGAILVVEGDLVNNQISYSYDFGQTWNKVNPNGASKIHPTSILCFPEGIAFGSDELPEGISWWDRPNDIVHPQIKNEDIYHKKTFNIGENIIGTIATKGMVLKENPLIGVIGFMNHNTEAPGFPRLFATVDGGRSWHQLYMSDNEDNEGGFFTTVLRSEKEDIKIYSRYSKGGTPNLFDATLPKFIEL